MIKIVVRISLLQFYQYLCILFQNKKLLNNNKLNKIISNSKPKSRFYQKEKKIINFKMLIKTPKKVNSSVTKSYSNNESSMTNNFSNGLKKAKIAKDTKDSTMKSVQRKAKKQDILFQQKQKKKKTSQKLHISNAFTNASVLTQRIRSCSKCCPNHLSNKSQRNFQGASIVTSKPKTANLKSRSLGKQAKATQCKSAKLTRKNDKKSEYMNKKVKEFQSSINSKHNSTHQGYGTKFNTNFRTVEENQFTKININQNMTQLQTFLNQGTEKIMTAKKSQNSFILSQVQRNQKNLIQKLQKLQMQNAQLQQTSQKKIQLLQKESLNQTSIFKSQINFLSQKVDQQNMKNIKIQEKVTVYQTSMIELKKQVNNKEETIKSLQVENQKLQQQNKNVNKRLQTFQQNMNSLQQNIYSLKKVKENLQSKLKKCQKEKEFIKQNSVQVLKILREECGQMFEN